MDKGTDRDLLRHALATLAYRAGKTLRDPPPGFADFRVGPTTRAPVEIVGHMADLMEWGTSIAEGRERWTDTRSDDWDEQVGRFYAGLADLDALLASERELAAPVGKLLQGPIADALTHTGQIAMLRRLAGGAVRGENYFRAEISPGRVGPEQATAVREFD